MRCQSPARSNSHFDVARASALAGSRASACDGSNGGRRRTPAETLRYVKMRIAEARDGHALGLEAIEGATTSSGGTGANIFQLPGSAGIAL